jgi:hypothetical protein
MSNLATRTRVRNNNLPRNGRHPIASQLSSDQVRLVIVTPSGEPGRFNASVNGELVVASSKQPFLDAARVLIERGCDSNSTLIMRHAGSDANLLIAKICIAARLAVQETEARGPELVRWKAFSRVDGEPLVEFGEMGATSAPAAAEPL